MAIRIEARIEPDVTRLEHNPARIPRLHPNNDPNVDPNLDEYGRMRRICHRFTRFRHRIVGFGPNLDPNYSRIFSQRYLWLCRSCILTYPAYSPVFCSVFGWILGAIRGILGRFGFVRVIRVYY